MAREGYRRRLDVVLAATARERASLELRRPLETAIMDRLPDCLTSLEPSA